MYTIINSIEEFAAAVRSSKEISDNNQNVNMPSANPIENVISRLKSINTCDEISEKVEDVSFDNKVNDMQVKFNSVDIDPWDLEKSPRSNTADLIGIIIDLGKNEIKAFIPKRD